MRSGGYLPRVGKRGKRNAAELRAVKADLLLRSRGRCESPGLSEHCTGYGTAAHHIVRRSQGGANTLDNLAWLCDPCHSYVHANPAHAFTLGLLRSGGAA